MDQARQFIDMIGSGDNISAKDLVDSILSARAFETLELKKQDLASTLFSGVTDAGVSEPVTVGEETEFNLEDFTPEEIEEFIMSEDFEQLDGETQNQIVEYFESLDEQAKWRKGYSASGHPPGFKHKNGDIGPIGGTYTNDITGYDGETSKVPVNKYRDDKDELADRGTSHTGTNGKPLTKKFATRKLKYMIKTSLGKHAAPVGKLPEEFEQLDELSKEKLGKYVKSATVDARINGIVQGKLEADSNRAIKPEKKERFARIAKDFQKNGWKRQTGVLKAVDRLTK